MNLQQFCDQYKCNLVAKRHHQTGKWDARMTHSWYNNPVLSACSYDNIDSCLDALETRLEKIPESMRSHLDKLNQMREKKMKEDEKYQDKDWWCDTIYGED